MMTIKDLLATEHALFLRGHAQAEFLHRLPPPPVVLELPDNSALHLTLYRYDLNDPAFATDRGGGVLTVTLDFGSLSQEDAEAQTQLPSTAPPQISLPPVTAGTLRLWMGGQEVFSGVIPETPRPILPIALPLTVYAATQLRAAAQQGQPVAHATAVGSLLLHYDGPAIHVRVDQDKSVRYLSERGPTFSAADVAKTLLPAMVEQGIIRTEIVADGDLREAMMLVPAITAGWLFEPEPDSEAWSAIPGIALAPYSMRGKVRLRQELKGVRSADVGGAISTVQVPWMASAPIGPLAPASINLVDLAETKVSTVQVTALRSGPSESYQDLRMEFEFPGGHHAVAALTEWKGGASEPHTLRFLRVSGQTTYRYRMTARDGARLIAGQWLTANQQRLVVNFTGLE